MLPPDGTTGIITAIFKAKKLLKTEHNSLMSTPSPKIRHNQNM